MSKNPRSVKRHGQDEEAPDFELVFTASGSVELIDTNTDEVTWSSDDDDAFAEEFDDYLDGEDAENVIEYLDENDYLDASEDIIDVVEEDLEDENSDEPIEGELIPAKTANRKKS